MKKSSKTIVISLFLLYLILVLGLTLYKNRDLLSESITKLHDSEKYKNANVVDKLVLNRDTFENTFKNNIYMEDTYIDIYGFFQKILMKRVIEDVDDGKRVIRMDNNNLTFVYPKKNINKNAKKIVNLSNYSKSKNIYMVYVNIPWRVNNKSDLPFYIKDYANNTNNKMISKMSKGNVNILNLEDSLSGDYNNWFYSTDHHWTTDTAFESYQIMINDIDDKLDIGLTSKYLFNFDKYKYNDIFLGTYGKRAGKYYGGMDDFTYITPQFDTQFEVINYTDVGKISSVKKGSFKEVFTYPKYLDKNLDRKLSVYYTYSEGTKAEINITNLAPYNDLKLLVIKDSFADNTYPFLALNFKKTKVIDVRRYNRIRLYTYINKYNPDVIIFLQNPSSLYDDTLFNWQEK